MTQATGFLGRREWRSVFFFDAEYAGAIAAAVNEPTRPSAPVSHGDFCLWWTSAVDGCEPGLEQGVDYLACALHSKLFPWCSECCSEREKHAR